MPIDEAGPFELEQRLPYTPKIPRLELFNPPISGLPGSHALRCADLPSPTRYSAMTISPSAIGPHGSHGGADPYTLPPAIPGVGYIPTLRRQPPNPIVITSSYARSREMPYETASAASWYEICPRSPASLVSGGTYMCPMPMSAAPGRTQLSNIPQSPMRRSSLNRRNAVESAYDSDEPSSYSITRRGRKAPDSRSDPRVVAGELSANQRSRQRNPPARYSRSRVDDVADDISSLDMDDVCISRRRAPDRRQESVYHRSQRPPSATQLPRLPPAGFTGSSSGDLGFNHNNERPTPRVSRGIGAQEAHPYRHRRVSSLSSDEYCSEDELQGPSRRSAESRHAPDEQSRWYHQKPSPGRERYDDSDQGYHPPPPRQERRHQRHHSLSHMQQDDHRRPRNPQDDIHYSPRQNPSLLTPPAPVAPRRRRAMSLAGSSNMRLADDYSDAASVTGSAFTFADGPMTAGGRASDYGLPQHAHNQKPDWRRFCVQRGNADVYM